MKTLNIDRFVKYFNFAFSGCFRATWDSLEAFLEHLGWSGTRLGRILGLLGGVLGVIHLGGDKQRWRSLRAHLVLLVFRQATVAPNLERSDAEGTVPMALAFSLAVVGVAFWGTPWA